MKLAAALLVSIPLFAQDPLVYIYREQIKTAWLANYIQIEESAARFCAKVQCPNPYLTLTSFTGSNEAWYINGFESMDAMEKVWQAYGASESITTELNNVAARKADLAFGASTLVARFHPEMSFYASQVAPRYFSIAVIQVRPTHAAAFREMRVRFKQTLERAGKPQWVYQVTSGTQDVTFIVMTPAHSMQEIPITPTPEDPNDIIVSSETRLYAVTPALSMPAQRWVDADPEFWKRP